MSIDLIWPGLNPGTISLPAAIVGDTGVIVEADNVVVRLTESGPLPPGSETLGTDWQGVYVGRARVHLPEGLRSALPSDLLLEKCSIGTGGFSGEVEVGWDPAFSGTLFGSPFSLKHFSLTFVQSTVAGAEIRGAITIPFFDESVPIEIGLNADGTFSVRLDSEDGLYTLTKAGLLTLTVDSFGLEVQNEKVITTVSGDLHLEASGQEWPSVKISEMTIHADGRVEPRWRLA